MKALKKMWSQTPVVARNIGAALAVMAVSGAAMAAETGTAGSFDIMAILTPISDGLKANVSDIAPVVGLTMAAVWGALTAFSILKKFMNKAVS